MGLDMYLYRMQKLNDKELKLINRKGVTTEELYGAGLVCVKDTPENYNNAP